MISTHLLPVSKQTNAQPRRQLDEVAIYVDVQLWSLLTRERGQGVLLVPWCHVVCLVGCCALLMPAWCRRPTKCLLLQHSHCTVTAMLEGQGCRCCW